MKREHIVFLGIFIALLPILIFRDYTPDNELKYLSIAEESIRDGNIFAFYNHGEPYADKPPLYLWIVTLGRLLFGGHCMFFLSLFSFLPAIVTVAVMNRWVKQESNCNEAINSLMLLSSAFFLACSFVLRMDMLMTMFITLAVYTFYKMYRFNNRGIGSALQYKRWQIVLPLYTFLAIFSKGAVGIMVPLMSIIVFLFINRKLSTIGRYIGWKFWSILAAACTVWFLGVFLDGGTEYLNNLLFNQTINRAVNSFHHKEPFYYYFITYWYAIAPWSIAVITAIIIGFGRRMIKGDMLRLFAVTSIGTFAMMSCVSSKIVIYLLPAFPFIVYLGGILIQRIKNNIWIKISIAIPAIIFILVQGAAIYAELNNLLPFKLWVPLYILTLILFAGGIAALCFLYRGETPKAIISICAAMYLLIFAAGFSIRELNDMIGLENGCEYARMEGEKLEELSGREVKYVFYDFRSGKNLDVYFNTPVEELKKEDLQSADNMIMVVKERRFRRDSALNATLGEMPRKIYGEFAIVTINNK